MNRMLLSELHDRVDQVVARMKAEHPQSWFAPIDSRLAAAVRRCACFCLPACDCDRGQNNKTCDDRCFRWRGHGALYLTYGYRGLVDYLVMTRVLIEVTRSIKNLKAELKAG